MRVLECVFVYFYFEASGGIRSVGYRLEGKTFEVVLGENIYGKIDCWRYFWSGEDSCSEVGWLFSGGWMYLHPMVRGIIHNLSRSRYGIIVQCNNIADVTAMIVLKKEK